MWKAKWMDFVTVTQMDTKPMAYQLAMFRHTIDDKARRVLETLEQSETSQEVELSVVLRRFRAYCEGHANGAYHLYLFFGRNRSPSEAFETFITELKLLAQLTAPTAIA
ncbi:unnamed protein product [Dicrocoelium dendriticum]|nr:unnamed protein product [Dicrocoelium dendriticum]